MISTVLPGVIEELIKPITDRANGLIDLIYNPYFIAMGTVIDDFHNPEFIVMGSEDGADENTPYTLALPVLEKFYKSLCDAPIMHVTNYVNAEIIKMTYNTWITQKIVFANTVMELCSHFKGADCDNVIDALEKGEDRIISGKYMRGGMGDGGACHPRDNIALSFLAKKLKTELQSFFKHHECKR